MDNGFARIFNAYRSVAGRGSFLTGIECSSCTDAVINGAIIWINVLKDYLDWLSNCNIFWNRINIDSLSPGNSISLRIIDTATEIRVILIDRIWKLIYYLNSSATIESINGSIVYYVIFASRRLVRKRVITVLYLNRCAKIRIFLLITIGDFNWRRRDNSCMVICTAGKFIVGWNVGRSFRFIVITERFRKDYVVNADKWIAILVNVMNDDCRNLPRIGIGYLDIPINCA